MKKSVLFAVTAAVVSFAAVSGPFIPLSHAAAAEQAPHYKTRTEIPGKYKWDLTHIYPDKKSWEADYQKVEKLAQSFGKKQGTLAASAANLASVLRDYADLMRMFEKVSLYASLSFDVNSANPELQEMSDRVSNLQTLISEKTAWVTPEIVAVPTATIQAYLKEKELADFRVFVGNMLRTKQYSLPKEMEELLAQSAPLAGMPEGVFRMLSKDVKLPKIKDEKGQEVQLTPANYVSYVESQDPRVRKDAFMAYYQTLAGFQDSFAQTLGAQVKADNYYAKARKFKSALEASLIPNDIPPKVYDELIETVHAHLPLLHRYMGLKKKLLGAKELHMYDIYTPIVKADTAYIPYEKAKELVLEGLQPLGDPYVKALQEGFDGGWIDVYSTEDKRTGAYQMGSYDVHPYLLLNYQGTFDDVSTLAHELGHAMHSYYTNKKQPYTNAGYATFTAEVASTLNETLLFKSMYAKAKTKQEKMYLLNHYLDTFRTTLFRQAQFAEFEMLIHEKEQAGESLNAEALKGLYLELNKKYYGKNVVSDQEIAMEWARIPHFYSDFYVYQYATSFAASQALAKQVLDEGKPAVDRIRENFLSAGSSDSPIAILKRAGVDMSTSKPIDQAMKIFEETLNELEKLSAEK